MLGILFRAEAWRQNYGSSDLELISPRFIQSLYSSCHCSADFVNPLHSQLILFLLDGAA